MRPISKSLLKLVVLAVAIAVVAATQVLAGTKSQESEQRISASGAEITELLTGSSVDTTASPTKDDAPKAAPKKSKPKSKASAPKSKAPKSPPAESKPRPRTSKPSPVAVAAPAPRPEISRSSSSGSASYTALLVGVNNAPGSTPLEGSITDVMNVKKALMKNGFKEENIVTLKDGQASRGGILNALDRFASRTSGKGLAVFHLSTHGGGSGGSMTFASGGGGRIAASELAAKLGRVPGKLWSNLATCYSGSFKMPGIIGKNRIAIFSSESTERSWQVGEAGSWMVIYMIKKGMIESDVSSVEGAYHYAKNKLQDVAPNRVPLMSDGISGDVRL